MDYKIVFFDVDGTLVNYEDGRIEESTMIAIEQLKTMEFILLLLQEDLYQCAKV